MSTAHVFYYRWPRIKEGLTHIEEHIPHPWRINEVYGPKGSWMTTDSTWYLRGIDPKVAWLKRDVEQVPKEIRLLALLVT